MSPRAATPASINNHVYLRGRLAERADPRELPSGDILTAFRVTVDRPVNERVRVDSLECATIQPRARKTLGRAEIGDEVELTGSLHRRFWRSPAGPASRYSVDAATVRLLTPGRRGGGSRGRTQASA